MPIELGELGGVIGVLEVMERKSQVERAVEQAAQAQHADDEDAVEQLVFDARERLERENLYGDIMTRPVSEIIDAICRDLGLHPDWARLAQEGWAQDEIASGAVGPPLAANLSPSSSHPPSSPSHALRPEGRRKPAPINVVERELAIRGPPSPG